ncbi:MAG: DUF692 domain-containing protein [Gammaproteobacteria bacterium]|nr:DUF692 domain-containing protein [Gammaproteobacteria bacterium]
MVTQHRNPRSRVAHPIPACAGIGLRAEHYEDILHAHPDVGWLEVHSENYFGERGRPWQILGQIREHYPVSLHGVGLSLGSTDPLDEVHLKQLKRLIEYIEPGLISEHVSWSSVQGHHFHDLLPLPYTEEALMHLAGRVTQAQEILGRQILMENLSSYVRYAHSTMSEWEFLSELVIRSGCGLLLDVNNVYVSAINHRFDPKTYLNNIVPGVVGEIHLAGHTRKLRDAATFIIDTHDQPVSKEVWDLYEHAVARFAGIPVLIEWDAVLPPLPVLVAEAQRAQHIMDGCYALTA